MLRTKKGDYSVDWKAHRSPLFSLWLYMVPKGFLGLNSQQELGYHQALQGVGPPEEREEEVNDQDIVFQFLVFCKPYLY